MTILYRLTLVFIYLTLPQVCLSSEMSDRQVANKIYSQHAADLIGKREYTVKGILGLEPDLETDVGSGLQQWYCVTYYYCIVVDFYQLRPKDIVDSTPKPRYRCSRVWIKKKGDKSSGRQLIEVY